MFVYMIEYYAAVKEKKKNEEALFGLLCKNLQRI